MTPSKLAFALLCLGSGWFPIRAQESPRVIPITAKRFEYRPNEVHLKKGQPVTLVLKSEDVTHGLLCRALKLDTDIPPGQETQVTVTPGQAGTFTAICNHFCGSGHGNMKLKFIVE
jgi:cytochrome c oxidase subunit 2